MSNSSIWPIERTFSDATISGQSGPGSNGNKGVHHILQSSSITGVSWSDLVSYPRHLFGGGGGESYPSVEMQSVYSTALADWALRY